MFNTVPHICYWTRAVKIYYSVYIFFTRVCLITHILEDQTLVNIFTSLVHDMLNVLCSYHDWVVMRGWEACLWSEDIQIQTIFRPGELSTQLINLTTLAPALVCHQWIIRTVEDVSGQRDWRLESERISGWHSVGESLK